ncbi:hypothetical protein D3C85_1139220 [compost metagenome]
MEGAQDQQHQEHRGEAERRRAPQPQLAADVGRQETAEDAEDVEHQRADRRVDEILAEQGRADQGQIPAHGEILDGLADLNSGRQDGARQVHAAKDQQHVGQAASGQVDHRHALFHRRRRELPAIDAGHRLRRVLHAFLAGQPDRAFHHVAHLQQQDDDREDSGGGDRIAPDRIAHIPREKQHGQQQVCADGRVPHALPGVQAALELDGSELGQHGHRDGEVDPVGRTDKKAANQNDFEGGSEHHQQRADDGQELGDDQRTYAAPAVRHPPAYGIEGNGHPRGERRHQRHLSGLQAQVARHRPQTRA